MLSSIVLLVAAVAPPPVPEPARPPVVIINRASPPSIIVVEPSYKSRVLRGLDWGMVRVEKSTERAVEAAKPYIEEAGIRTARAGRMAGRALGEWLGMAGATEAIPAPPKVIPATPKIANPPALKIDRSDVPLLWEKHNVTENKDGCWFGTFVRKDYKGFKRALSKDHMTVLIVGTNAKVASDKAEQVLESMRKNNKDGFRLSTPVDDHVWVITQGDDQFAVLGENAITRARGEIAHSHQKMVEWISETGRADALKPR